MECTILPMVLCTIKYTFSKIRNNSWRKFEIRVYRTYSQLRASFCRNIASMCRKRRKEIFTHCTCYGGGRGRPHTAKAWAVDCCSRFSRENQSFSTWRWLRVILTPSSENCDNFKLRQMSWACHNVGEMLLILINLLSTRLIEAKS